MPRRSTPASQLQLDIELVCHVPGSIRREDKRGLVWIIYYSNHIYPSPEAGAEGDFYLLLNPPTLFWKTNRWQPWSWKTYMTHPLSEGYVLNFDLRGPVWTFNSGRNFEPCFTTYREAVVFFFNSVVKTKSDLGSESKPIIID